MQTKVILLKAYKFKKKWKLKKAHRAIGLMNSIINSEAFKSEVLGYDFSDRRYRYDNKSEWEEIENNERIYEILMKGNEQYKHRIDDYVWTLKIKLGKFLSQVGRREKDLIITQNWFIRKSTDAELAAHWIHEYAHVLGFNHDYDRTARRPNSIPYGLGTIAQKVLKKIMEKDKT